MYTGSLHSPDVASDGTDSDIYASTPQSAQEVPDSPRTLTPGKRKRDQDSPSDVEKRQKMITFRSQLEAAFAQNKNLDIWQKVFTFLSPRTLARILRVSKKFQICLQNTEAEIEHARRGGAFVLSSSDSVWKASRELHFPGMPAPPVGLSEQDLWKLLTGRHCLVCEHTGTMSKAEAETTVVWAFATRLCQDCIGQQTQDEQEMLFSDASYLRPFLPTTTLNQDNVPVTQSEMRERRIDISTVKKVFYRPQIDTLVELLGDLSGSERKQRFEALQVETLGRMSLANQWEQWERSGGWSQLQTPINGSKERQSRSRSPSAHYQQQGTFKTPPLHHPLPGSSQTARSSSQLRNLAAATPLLSTNQFQQTMDTRRYQIQQRCMQSDPQIPLNLLPRMHSFDTAMQINRELVDEEWDALKPHLLSEVAEANLAILGVERQGTETSSLGEEPKRMRSEDKLPDSKEWEDQQFDIRARLSDYADRVISNDWQSGKLVNKRNAPDFAVQVLQEVREQWAKDRQHYGTLRPGEEAVPRGSFPVPDGVLTLDAMKWVYNVKISGIVGKPEKKLFACRMCIDDDSMNTKDFSFESLVQHYASIHGDSSQENTSGVSWKTALWPWKRLFASVHSARVSSNHHRSHFAPVMVHRGKGPPRRPIDNVKVGSNRPFYVEQQPTMAMQDWHPAAYMGQPSAPLPPPQYQTPAPAPWTQYPAVFPAQGFPSPVQTPHSTFGGYTRPPTAIPGVTPGYPIPQPPVYSPSAPGGERYAPPPGTTYPHAGSGTSPMQYSTAYGSAFPPPVSAHVSAPQNSFYQNQLEELGQNAREIYLSLSKFYGMPPSVSIHCAIQRSVHRFRNRYANELSFELFFDCFAKHPSMFHIRNVERLTCNNCHLHRDRESAAKKYSFYDLLLHFKLVHLEGLRGPSGIPTDWTENLLGLPSREDMRQLVSDPDLGVRQREIIQDNFEELLEPSPNPMEHEYDPRHPQVRNNAGDRVRHQGHDEHQHPSRDSNDQPPGRQGSGRLVHLADGEPYELVPIVSNQGHGDRYEDNDNAHGRQRGGSRQPRPQESRRPSDVSHRDRPRIKREPTDDDQRASGKRRR